MAAAAGGNDNSLLFVIKQLRQAGREQGRLDQSIARQVENRVDSINQLPGR